MKETTTTNFCSLIFARSTNFLLKMFSDVKGKTVPFHGMKACKGRRRIAPLITNLATAWRSEVELHDSADSPPGKNPGMHSLEGWVGPAAGLEVLEKREISYPYRDSSPGPPSPQVY
jgi:hypothetical protein